HPLVEGLLLELEDGPRGRAALLELPAARCGFRGAALLLAEQTEGRSELRLIDADGSERPERLPDVLAALPHPRPLEPAVQEALEARGGFGERVRELAGDAARTASAAAWLIAR